MTEILSSRMDFDSFLYSDRTVLSSESVDSHVDGSRPTASSTPTAVDVWNYLLSLTESELDINTTTLPMQQHQPTKLKHFKATDFDPSATKPRIGGGACYSVDKCTLQPPFGSAIVAVKRLKIFPIHGGSNNRGASVHGSIATILRELHILTHPPVRQHYNITALLGYTSELATTSGSASADALRHQRVEISLVVEFGSHGTLAQFLSSNKSNVATKTRFMHDVASGLEALHSCGIVQGDVKVENTLVFDDKHAPGGYVAKLSDFGHAIVNVDSDEGVTDRERYLGTMVLNAPEVRSRGLVPHDAAVAVERGAFYKCDVFSYGLLVWEVAFDGARFLSTLNTNAMEGEYDDEVAWLNSLPKDDLLRRGLALLREKIAGDEVWFRIWRQVMEATIRDVPGERKTMKEVVEIFREQKRFRDDAR
jgi:hypothetical protein